MSKNRIKITGPAVKTREEMERIVGEIAEAKIQQQRLTARMDADLLAVRERYEQPLGDLAEQIDAKMTLAAAWAEANPSEFGKGKSIDMVHAVVGFRTGMPQAKTLRGWTWDRVLEKLKALKAVEFIRVKEDVNKQMLLAPAMDANWLREAGVVVVQEESFFVEPKLTEVATRETA